MNVTVQTSTDPRPGTSSQKKKIREYPKGLPLNANKGEGVKEGWHNLLEKKQDWNEKRQIEDI